ncbi:MAG: tetratricopeptide repeat protein, partial [Planctomycetes bacterium]|nr:tetratricopeptide repeat protein [Planctomycetota bacterium]
MTDLMSCQDSFDQSGARPVEHSGPTSSPFSETDRQSAELAAMRRMLAASRGTFSLSIAVCNSPALRAYLVNKLLEDDAAYVAVSMPRGTENFLDYALADLGSRTPSALFLVDLENSLPSDGPRPAIRLLNATREKWQQCFACPVVLWLPEYAVKLLAIEAKDFWSWRSHQFEFVAESAEPTPASSGAFVEGIGAAFNLDVDRKQFRIAELRERIEAGGDDPEPEMATHVTTWLNELGMLLVFVGKLDEAETASRKALEISDKLGRLEGTATEYGNLGIIFWMRSALDEAEKMYRKALEIDKR